MIIVLEAENPFTLFNPLNPLIHFSAYYFYISNIEKLFRIVSHIISHIILHIISHIVSHIFSHIELFKKA